MVWKFLSGISAACLGVALYFAYISKNDIHEERLAEQRAKANFATVQNYKKKADDALVQKATQLKGLEADRDKLKTDVVTAEADSKKKEEELAQAKKTLTETVEQLTAMQKKIEEAGDVTKLVAQVKALQDDKKSAEAVVATEAGKVTAITEKLAGLVQQAEKLRTVEANSRKGVIEPTFTARVAQAFTDWGFAVLNKGNNGGVIANAELEVKRGKNIVARLKVRNVEQAIAVADIVPGSLVQGYTVRSGDLVVAAPVKVEPPKPVTPPPAAGGATPPAAAPGAAPAPAPAMGAADPFAPAPAAGAPAAAPAAAPGAAPAMADPFAPAPGAAPAPAPAPATPPAEAPPAGAGTKTSPSTADPFAPAK